ncbi:unnamed protein product [Mesocestoides corti]|uniref:ETS domain-containing protein n=2 Tax=Mesocestoides corti TaxID=53468 RepID=A0A0R3U8G7_MESCO|nr:unnamed protein product [Mesocestoides corti]
MSDLEFDTSKGKVTLWQFLLQLLLDPRYSDIIRWTNNAGEFVLLRAEEVARLWGLRKDNNHRMNYDKLSRALRYYYQKNIIRKVQGHKFVYQFIGLHRLRGLMRLHAADKLPADSYFSTDHIRPHRRQSASAKSLSSISPEGHLNEFSPFQKPNHFDSFPGPPFSCSPKSSPMTLSTQESSKFSLHLPNSFSPTLNPQLSLGTSNTSVLHSPPMELSDPTSDFARACTSLQKNSEALHYSMASKDNVDAIASLACKEVLRALIPNRPSTDRSARRQSSPNCHCSCHCSAATNKLVETHPPHFSPPSLTPQKPRSTECWPPTNEGLQEDTLSSSTSDHRSYLHWQRHMINMNRLKEQIQRVAGGEDRKPPIFRPFDSPQSDPLKHGEVGSVRRAPASSDDRSGNYIWMPIQVDLVGHFMTMLSQSLQSHQPREPPPAHSTSSPSSSSSSSSNANTSSVTHG